MKTRSATFLVTVLLGGCALALAPVLISERGPYNCNSLGQPIFLNMSTARSIVWKCVGEKKSAGYVELPDVMLGVIVDWSRIPKGALDPCKTMYHNVLKVKGYADVAEVIEVEARAPS